MRIQIQPVKSVTATGCRKEFDIFQLPTSYHTRSKHRKIYHNKLTNICTPHVRTFYTVWTQSF